MMEKDTAGAAGYDWTTFDGYEAPRYTQVPDVLLDEQMPLLGHAELKVLLYIVRKTFGWGKSFDAISLKQLARGTGLGMSSVKRAVKDLEAAGAIVVRRDETKRGDSDVNSYGLRMADGRPRMDLPQAQNGPTKNKRQFHKRHEEQQQAGTSGEEAPAGVVVEERMKTIGVKPAPRRKLLAKHDPATIGTVLDYIDGNPEKVAVPAAFLVAALNEGWDLSAGDAGEEGEDPAAEERLLALSLARNEFAALVGGGNWNKAQERVARIYGPELAAEVVTELQARASG